MEYIEKFMKMGLDLAGNEEAIITVLRSGQTSSIGLYRICGNKIKSDNEAIDEYDYSHSILWDGHKYFKKGIYLYKFKCGICVDEKYISHFVPETIFNGALQLAIYQEYGLEPYDEHEKQCLEKAIKAEAIKDTLVYACYINDNEKIKHYLENPELSNVQLNKTLKLAGTPLTLCAKHNNLEAFKAILDKGADINKKVSGQSTPLITAMMYSSYDIVMYIFENMREQFDKEVKDFKCASYCEDVRILQLLADLGFDYIGEGTRWPLLHLFAEYKNLIGIKFLLDKGVDINLKDSYGLTISERAQKNGNKELLKFLEEQGYFFK